MSVGGEHILILDDETVVRRLLNLRLSQKGFVCHEAGNAGQAIAVLKSEPIALALLDIKMSGKSGMDLLPEIVAGYPDVAIIMVTAVNDTQVAIECMKRGAYDYLTKPFNIEEVILGAGRALEKRRLVLENRVYQHHLEEKVSEQAQKIKLSFLNTIKALAYALEAKDQYTRGHSDRVADMAVIVAQKMGLPCEEQDNFRLAGLIHDIGKIGVAGSVLNKPGRLTANECEQIKQHCAIGERILRPVIEDEAILQIVRHHHERFDGKGYPDGLAGKDIPLPVAILMLCDSFDAMTSARSYRAAMSVEAACNEIGRCRGSQFVPEVVDAFLSSGAVEYCRS